MDDLVWSQPSTACRSRHAVLHVTHMSDGECHVIGRSPRVYGVCPSSGESPISYSLSLIEALLVGRYEDVVDAGSSRVLGDGPHRTTSARVESARVVEEMYSILNHDAKEALTMLLLRCLIDLEPSVRCEVQ